MAVNVLAPNGLVWARSIFGSAPTSQANVYYIRKGFVANNIGVGDLVKTGSGANQGYVVPSVLNDSSGLGVFVNVLSYYDLTFQGTMHGLNGSFQLSSNPSSDIPCVVISDLTATFRVQGSGIAFAQSMRGQNINWLAGSNAAPSAAGISTLAVDMSTVGTLNTLPLRILGVAGVTGGPQDPANTNPTLEVMFNPNWLEMMQGTGI